MSRKYFAAQDTDYTRKLAEYAVKLEYSDLPDEVVERVKMMTMHTLGVSLAASPVALSNASIRVARAANGGTGGGASVWLGGERLSAAAAAYANGTIADILDWEDCAWTGHPSAGVIPVAMAMAEERGCSGKEYIAAVTAGLEVYQRVAMAVQPPADFDHNRGWALCNWQIFATCTPAAKLLKLDGHKMNQTFGMACMYAAMPTNVQQATMSNAYHYQHGIAAQNGILAALSAAEGVDNLEDCFDIPYAYCEQLTSAVDRSWLNRRLGEHFYTQDILIKHWPANMWLQTPLELLSLLVKEHRIRPEDVEEIVLDPPTQYRMHCYDDGFSSLMDAQFSIPFVLAAYLLDPQPGPNWYAPERLTNPEVLELAKKVKAGPGRETTLMESFIGYQNGKHPEKTLTVKLKNGQVFSRTQSIHKGHPADMLSREEFKELFRREASFALSPERTEALIDFIVNLEKVDDMASFHKLIA